MLTLSVLMENAAASDGFVCEHGLSFFLESDDAAILFDTGPSGAFLGNAARMGCDIAKATHIVLSHGHYDHTGGLGAALGHIRQAGGGRNLPPVIAHPGVTAQRRRPLDSPLGAKDLGIPADGRRELAAWPVTLAREPLRITERIVFLGEIPRTRPELCALTGEAEQNGAYAKDMLPDDTALACITDKGLLIVAGCSHSGIVNIIEHAKKVTGVKEVRAVYGGLHCKDMTAAAIAETRKALSAENLEEIYACHCTGGILDDFPGQLRLAAGKRHTAR